MLASSELGNSDFKNITYNYLPKEFDIPVFAYGHAYFDLMGSLGLLSSVDEHLSKDSKILIIVSPGWFEKNNLLPQAFIEHFPDDILKLATRNINTAKFFGDYLLNNFRDFVNLTAYQIELTGLSNGLFAKIKHKYLSTKFHINNFFYEKKQQIGLAELSSKLAIGDLDIKVELEDREINYQKLKNTDWAKVEDAALKIELQNMDENSFWIETMQKNT